VQAAPVAGLLAGEGVEERRLARAVGADDADPVARADHGRGATEEHSVADALFEIFESQEQVWA